MESAFPKSQMISVTPDVRLEVIDYGGEGDPVLLLAGLSNTAHIYDEFAPKLANDFHVMALTRRGFGASSQPVNDYAMNTLASDILTILDSLNITKVTLVGHSIAGDEMTTFASQYPERTHKLVYLDAAYDRTDMNFLALAPAPPEMTNNDSASWESLQRYYRQVYGMLLNESDIKATRVFSSSGRYIGNVTPNPVYGAIVNGIRHPTYEWIKSPALAIFAVEDSPRDAVDYYDQLDSAGRADAEKFFNALRKDTQAQIATFKKSDYKLRGCGAAQCESLCLYFT